jgi:hypothetical protein
MTFLAALTQSTPSPESVPQIWDDVSMVRVPIPGWVIAVAAVCALLLATLAIYLVRRWLRSRPPVLPPSARSVALRELDALQTQVNSLEPHEFSFAVSDVLRKYIGAGFGLAAPRQTSPEFLATIAKSPAFSDSDRQLLGEFLEHCDLIKFARIDATSADSMRLWESAAAFVRGSTV